jgi:hypothetical protein
MVVEGMAPNSHVRGLGGVGAGKGRGMAAAKMASRKVRPVLMVDGEVTMLEVRVRVEEAKAEAEAEKGLEGHVAWLGLVAREVAGMSWEKDNDLHKSDTVQLVADGRPTET